MKIDSPSSEPSFFCTRAAAYRAMRLPPFMSSVPGPVMTPLLTANGMVSSVPMGHTVSWWPIMTTFRGCVPNRHSRWGVSETVMIRGATPSSSLPTAA